MSELKNCAVIWSNNLFYRNNLQPIFSSNCRRMNKWFTQERSVVEPLWSSSILFPIYLWLYFVRSFPRVVRVSLVYFLFCTATRQHNFVNSSTIYVYFFPTFFSETWPMMTVKYFRPIYLIILPSHRWLLIIESIINESLMIFFNQIAECVQTQFYTPLCRSTN